MHKILSLLLFSASAVLLSRPASAGEYLCPQQLEGAPAQAKSSAGFESWRDPQSKPLLETVDLYDGPPDEMAQLEPDLDYKIRNESKWSLNNNERGFWMVCRYSNTDMRLIKKIDQPKESCHTKRAHGENAGIVLVCK